MFKITNPKLQDLALTHRSFTKNTPSQSNERLEFLGDALLELWATTTLYHKFPNYDEGKLTHLRSRVVCTPNLAHVSKKLGLDKKVKLSTSEEQNGGRQNESILADTFEAILGAIYLDSNYTAVEDFLNKNLLPSLEDLSKLKEYKDPKTHFQELVQAKELTTPHYQTIKEDGPDHKKIFTVAVFIGQKQIATGSGNSKQQAEFEASLKATQIYQDKV